MNQNYVGIKIHRVYVEKIDALVKRGLYSSRAEVVRAALRLLFDELRQKDCLVRL